MSKSAKQLSIDTITTLAVKAPVITVAPTSTATEVYNLVHPVSEATATVGADAERTLHANSFLGAVGNLLDNVIRDINVVRLHNETDNSVKNNAGKIFTPNATITTVIDKDEVDTLDNQLDNIKPKTYDQLFALMKSKFFRLKGATDLPMIGPRYWAGCAFLLRAFYDHIAMLVKDYVTEDSDDIANTDWIYNFDARRVIGVRDSKVAISDYNELTIYVYVDERIDQDSRGVKLLHNESSILVDVKRLASYHLPKPDHVTLQAPTLIVKSAPTKHVFVKGIVIGIAKLSDVIQAAEDYFYQNKRIGEPLSVVALTAAMKAVQGVLSISLSNPNDSDLTPTQFEILDVGFIDLRAI